MDDNKNAVPSAVWLPIAMPSNAPPPNIPPPNTPPPPQSRIIAAAYGTLVGGILGAIAGTFWFFIPGFALGGLCGALIGLNTPPRVGRAMLLSYIVVAMLSFIMLLKWRGSAQFNDRMAAPVGSGAGTSDLFIVWPLSVLIGLAAAAVVAVGVARPWQNRTRQLLSWVGVTAAVLPLLLPGAGAGLLLAAMLKVEAVGQADDDRRDAQRAAEAQNLEREKTRLRAAAQHLVRELGALRYPGATPPALVADGMSFTCDTTDPVPTIVAYYERVLGRRFRMRPANDGGTSAFYNDVFTLADGKEAYVYIQAPTNPGTAARITLSGV